MTEPLQPTPEFLTACEGLSISFDPPDITQLGLYLALMLETNKTFNLTAITDPSQAWMKHIFDSLTLIPVLAQAHGLDGKVPAVIDIGSGGGVPGIPLAITMPGVEFTLVDATGKKAAFLKQTVETLGLKNVAVLHDRAERLGRDPHHRERYDAAIARALGPLNVLAELTVPLVRMRGTVLAIKGAKADQELAEAVEALRVLGAVHEETLQTPTGRIIVLSKGMKTPRDYPRPDGTPKAKPIGGSSVPKSRA